MSYDQLMNISASGMALERLRVDVVANNLANQNTIAKTNGHLYQPMRVIATARPTFEKHFATDIQVLPENVKPNMVYEPNNLYANKLGYVEHPGINLVDEMTTLLSAERSYEADVKAFNVAKGMAQYALSIGDAK